jgi:hypothetical protein
MNNKLHSVLPVVLLTVAVAVSGLLMLNVSHEESAVMDELAHIPAGYSYARYLDYRLNPEHPPLLKALAGLPLLGLDLNFPLNNENWTSKLNAQWDMGSLFLYHSGNNADQIVETARIFPIIITLLTILLIYIWSRELMGKWWALLPAFIFGISPTVLAQGHYVTTDIAATFGFLLSIYLFIKFLNDRKNKNLIWAGIGFGIALLLKFSTVLLPPLLALILFFFWLGETIRKKTSGIGEYNFRHFAGRAARYIWDLILIFLIAGLVVYAVYFIFTFNYPPARQLSDTSQILQGFQPQWLSQLDINLVKNNFTRPIAQYFLGILMVLQRSSGGNTSYFLGHVSNSGWWYYFPVVFLLKESLPALMLLAFGLFLGLKKTLSKILSRNIFKNFAEYLGTNLAEFGMLLVIIVYWLYSIKSPLNIGFRHILPTIPFIYMLIASTFKNWSGGKLIKFIKYGFLALMLIWTAGETAIAYPYFLSYFNEAGGGTMNGYKYVTDSNFDWGQDLKHLQSFVKDQNIQKIAVDYFGGGDIKYYLGNAAEEWHSNSGNPKNADIEWLAISAEFLQNSIQPADESIDRKPDENYGWLQNLRPVSPGMGNVPTPDYRVGTSIFVYHL